MEKKRKRDLRNSCGFRFWNMNEEALRIIKLVNALSDTTVGRARSKADFISKLGIVEEGADESMFWLKIIIESGIFSKELINPLLVEANEVVARAVASLKSSRFKIQNLNSKA